jgi:hypothetical protein
MIYKHNIYQFKHKNVIILTLKCKKISKFYSLKTKNKKIIVEIKINNFILKREKSKPI